MKQKRIGIDAGGSLIKLAYEEMGRIHYKKVDNTQLDQLMDWLKFTSPNSEIILTGGQAGSIQKKHFPNSTILPEFETIYKGIQFLIKQQNLCLPDKYILVNIGTGTSIFKIEGSKSERLLGSGIGGGTLLGLGSLLAGTHDFNKLIELAEQGDRRKVDLLVKDVYDSEEAPINGDLTASNFAKAGKKSSSSRDKLASLINMMAETIILLSMQVALGHESKHIVFIGSTLVGNAPLKNSLENYANMLDLEAVFIPNGEFAGALGGLTPLEG